MRDKPTVSVVMPLYNKASELKRAINSVLSQTFQNFELVVVNDGSTDRGPDIVRSIEDSRIRIFDQKNAGASAARNRGIGEAHSELIAFLDADDEWKPNFLKTILKLQERYSECSVFATNYLYFVSKGNYRQPIIRGVPPHPWDGILMDYFAIASKSDPPLCSSAVAVKKSAIQSVGMFPVGVTSGEDLLTWATLACKYQIVYSTSSNAVFHIPVNIHDRPGRFENTNDFVGKSLIKLIDDMDSSKKISFKKYIALWYKMQTVSLLQAGNKKEALKRYRTRFLYSKNISQFICYVLLKILPVFFINFTIKNFRPIKR